MLSVQQSLLCHFANFLEKIFCDKRKGLVTRSKVCKIRKAVFEIFQLSQCFPTEISEVSIWDLISKEGKKSMRLSECLIQSG